ncbi:MAG TPA: DNA polymerase III subunit alpha, partial [Chitinophagaceae bacterium]|nr:DNA polymerase III subunit alpha [Chitinophagaceae bacterium]
STGMQKYLRDLKPDKFDDLIAMNALYRPGPLAYIPDFIDRKHGRQQISYDVPDMEEYLKDTYGITVYQEQVMLLSQKLAGFSKGDADVLRKAMGKKDRKTLDKMKGKFMDGAVGKGHPKDKLEKIWTDWEAFAQYAFNKSHSTCYAYVAYHTAYLKAHYPSEYMAAVLNNAGAIEKITFFMEECKRMGLQVMGPDINESLKGFAVNSKGVIRFGLGGLKGVGEAAVESIIEERGKKGPFTNIFDFIKRINQRTVNKKTLESLVYAGGFDCFPEMHRAQYFFVPPGDTSSGLEKIIRFGNIFQMQLTGNTNTLFGDLPAAMDVPLPKIPGCEPWTLTELLNYEKDVTGVFMSGHPLDHFRFEIRHYGLTTMADFNELKETVKPENNNGRPVRLAGLIIDAQHRVSRQGKNFGSIMLEDYSGKSEFMLWSEDYNRFRNYMEKGTNLFVTGSFKQRRYNTPELEFKIDRIMLLESIKQTLTKQVVVEVEARHVSEDMVQFFEKNVKSFPGTAGLKFNIIEPKSRLRVSMTTLGGGF